MTAGKGGEAAGGMLNAGGYLHNACKACITILIDSQTMRRSAHRHLTSSTAAVSCLAAHMAWHTYMPAVLRPAHHMSWLGILGTTSTVSCLVLELFSRCSMDGALLLLGPSCDVAISSSRICTLAIATVIAAVFRRSSGCRAGCCDGSCVCEG